MQFKSSFNSLLYHTSQTNKLQREKQKKTDKLIKSGNGHKNLWDSSQKVRETMMGKIYRKGYFWVWNGREMEWSSSSTNFIATQVLKQYFRAASESETSDA